METVPLILKKAHGERLSDTEIEWMVMGYLRDRIPDYQMSAFLMAVCQRGMDTAECTALTRCMRDSGECLDLSGIGHPVCDKHSTGGVGDKTTLVVLPVVAACGGYGAKMSGRGLGYTGGTVDKLHAIPGFSTELSLGHFIRQVQTEGLAVVEQMKNLVPADKKIYALRDVTGTVESIPLIASSILSKKLASGADVIVIDVKYGRGAFMKERNSATALGNMLRQVGSALGKEVHPVLSSMDVPLGCAVGNTIEVREAIDVLRGGGPEDVRSLSVTLAAKMLALSGMGSEDECWAAAVQSLKDGSAYDKFCRMVWAQGGDVSAVEDVERLPAAKYRQILFAERTGKIRKMQTDKIGEAAVTLGAGRRRKDAEISYGAGLMVFRKTGEIVKAGDALAEFYSDDKDCITAASRLYRDAVTVE